MNPASKEVFDTMLRLGFGGEVSPSVGDDVSSSRTRKKLKLTPEQWNVLERTFQHQKTVDQVTCLYHHRQRVEGNNKEL